MKILVVEDDSEIRATLLDAFREEGCQAQGASNGSVALKVLGEEEGWLVFLDWMMPVLDGRAVVKALQANPHLREKNQFILMSALSERRLKDAQLASGVFTDILPKPFELEEVLALLHRLDQEPLPTSALS
jgi:DNA-binding response OmpR family regulator